MKSFCDTWEKIHREHEWGKYPSENVVRFIARNYYNMKREDIKILDFGCGGGANTWFLARERFDVYAFDGSPSAIKKTERYLAEEGCSAHLAVMDGVDLEYGDGIFDCVIDNFSACANLYNNICKMYKEIFRVLKKGGRIYTSCFGIKTEGSTTGEYLEEGTFENIEKGVLAGRGIVHIFAEEELQNILIKTGFININIDSVLYTDNGMLVETFIARAEK